MIADHSKYLKRCGICCLRICFFDILNCCSKKHWSSDVLLLKKVTKYGIEFSSLIRETSSLFNFANTSGISDVFYSKLNSSRVWKVSNHRSPRVLTTKSRFGNWSKWSSQKIWEKPNFAEFRIPNLYWSLVFYYRYSFPLIIFCFIIALTNTVGLYRKPIFKWFL